MSNINSSSDAVEKVEELASYDLYSFYMQKAVVNKKIVMSKVPKSFNDIYADLYALKAKHGKFYIHAKSGHIDVALQMCVKLGIDISVGTPNSCLAFGIDAFNKPVLHVTVLEDLEFPDIGQVLKDRVNRNLPQ